MPVHCVCQSPKPILYQMPFLPSHTWFQGLLECSTYTLGPCPVFPITAGTTLMKPCTCLSPHLIQSKPLEDRECVATLFKATSPIWPGWREGKPVQCGIKSSGEESGRVPSYLTSLLLVLTPVEWGHFSITELAGVEGAERT